MAKGKKAGKGTSFGRNSSTAPSTGSSIGTVGLKNPAAAKAYGARGKLGNPSSSMTSLTRNGKGV